ncbi:MAG TPA: hypothetical protein VMX74_05980 [Pirellulales bacterium]|nr:hypothetical protein [Pirellulales bacterium]
MSSKNSSQWFCFEILKGAYVFHRHLFLDDIDAHLHYAGYPGSNIYYLVRAPKVRFVHDECIVDDQTLHCCISVGAGRKIETSIKLQNMFPFSQNPEIENYRFDVCVSPDQSDTTVLDFSPRSNPSARLPVDISAILGSLDLDLGARPEVLYVGQSTEILNRWQSHKQVNRALSMLSDSEELRLYFLHFQFFAELKQYDEVNGFDNDENFKCLLNSENRESEEFRDRISILEQTLIHFYRPTLNTQHVTSNLNTAPFNRTADKIGSLTIGMSIGMHGHAFDFWSPSQVLETEVATLSSDGGNVTFTPGLPDVCKCPH